jgi:hypothetical protein
MAILPEWDRSAESEKPNQLCVLGDSSAAPRSGMQARAVKVYKSQAGFVVSNFGYRSIVSK